MKRLILLFLLAIGITMHRSAIAQNVSMNVLTRESGLVKKGGTVFFEVTVNNTSSTDIVGTYKLKAQIAIADSTVVAIEAGGHQLPTGWEVINNDGNVITISNGKDLIAPNDARTILILLKGRHIGGPVTVSGQISFSNGIAPGNDPGSLNADKPADNFSTSSCKVID